MATGTLTLALLAWSTAAVPPDVVPMNSRNFQIPIHIAEGQRSKIKELILFVSSDQGRTWNEVSVVAPDKDAFIFYAQTDGLYWFNICVVDAQGHREPPDIYKSVPRQKVLVDTLQPIVRIVSADRQGDDIVVAWEIQEEYPDLATLKLEHRAADAPGWMWTPVSISAGLIGQAHFRVATFGPVQVHLQLADQAGNIGDAQTEVRAKPGAMSPSAPTVVPAALQGNATTPIAQAVPVAPAAANGGTWTPPSSNINGYAQPPNQAAAAPPPRSPWESSSPVQPALVRDNNPPGMPERSWASTSAPVYQQAGAYSPDPRNPSVAALTNSGSTYPPVAAANGLRGPGDAAAPLEITNSTQVALDYEVKSLGPSGVGKVELYLTTDEGRTWQHHHEDQQPRPGMPMTVNLPGEGIFGLRLVATSRAGLARKPPQPGDLPQMRIEVDTTPPVAKLFPPQPDPNRRDALLLTWNANDRNLAANPIWLQYAEGPNGPWQNIAKELPNSGRYLWQLSPNQPFKVYLRLIAFDAAGNYGMDQTPDAVLIDLNEPEAQIKRIIKPPKQ